VGTACTTSFANLILIHCLIYIHFFVALNSSTTIATPIIAVIPPL
jgi:hypothetical protein